MLNIIVGIVFYAPMLLVCVVFVLDGLEHDRSCQRRGEG